MKGKLWFVLAPLMLVLALLVTLPARVVISWLGPERLPLKLYQVEGTVWNGQAAIMAGSVAVDELKWSVAWRDLLRLRAGLDLQVKALGGKGWAHVSTAGKNELEVDDLHFALPASGDALASLLPVSLGGYLTLNLSHASVQAGKLAGADGEATWEGAQVALEPPLLLGDLQATVATVNDHPEVRLQDKGGPLEVSGSLNPLGSGMWQLAVRLRPRAQASADLRSTLTMLGSVAADGSVNINQRLRLPF